MFLLPPGDPAPPLLPPPPDGEVWRVWGEGMDSVPLADGAKEGLGLSDMTDAALGLLAPLRPSLRADPDSRGEEEEEGWADLARADRGVDSHSW